MCGCDATSRDFCSGWPVYEIQLTTQGDANRKNTLNFSQQQELPEPHKGVHAILALMLTPAPFPAARR